MTGNAQNMHPPVSTSITNKTYSRRSSTVSTWKKSEAKSPCACARRNWSDLSRPRGWSSHRTQCTQLKQKSKFMAPRPADFGAPTEAQARQPRSKMCIKSE